MHKFHRKYGCACMICVWICMCEIQDVWMRVCARVPCRSESGKEVSNIMHCILVVHAKNGAEQNERVNTCTEVERNPCSVGIIRNCKVTTFVPVKAAVFSVLHS